MTIDEMLDPGLEAMLVAERLADHDKQVARIVEHAYRLAPAIRAMYDKVGVSPAEIKSVRNLERVPMISKDMLPKLQAEDPPFGGFLTVPIHKLRRVYVSPGPIYDPEPSDEDYARNARMLYAMGFCKGDVVLNTFTYHMAPAGLLIEGGLLELGAVVVPAGVGNTETQLRIAHDLGVTGYVGTPSFLSTLITRAEEMGHDFADYLRIRKALLGAEKLAPSLAKRFEGVYGIRYGESYGTADLGTIAFQCSQRQGMHLSENLIVEIVDPQTGKQLGPHQEGEVVATSLNDAYPLIRFRTGDLSAYYEEPCSCGRTSYRLKGILGRVGEAIKVRGMFVHPGQLVETLSVFPQIANHQMVVTRAKERDFVTLRVELSPEATGDRDKLISQLLARFRDVCRVGCDEIDICPQGQVVVGQKRIVDNRTWD